jgi:hypothetical protein
MPGMCRFRGCVVVGVRVFRGAGALISGNEVQFCKALKNVAVCHTTQNGGPQVGIPVAKCVTDSWEG